MVEHGLNLKCYGMNLQLIVLKGLKQWIKIFPAEISVISSLFCFVGEY